MGVLQINQNIIAFNALRSLSQTARELERSVERLSSGLRINRAADDAAGLTISERLRAQVRGLARASQNASEGISFIQTAEGALNETNTILQRVRELAIQAANGILTANDRLEIQKEVDQLINEIDHIAKTTEFNTRKLLDGSAAALISVDDPTRTEVIVNGSVGKGGNFQIRTKLLEGPQLGIWKSDQFNTIAGEDRVGDINGLTTFLNNATFVGDFSQTGVAEIEVQSLDQYGRLMVSGGSATLSILGISVADATTAVIDLFQAKGVTEGTDRLKLRGYDVNGALVDQVLLITAALTVADLAAFVSTAFFDAASQGLVSIAGDGKLYMSNAATTSMVLTSLYLDDVDLSGSQLNLNITAFSLPAGTNSIAMGDTLIQHASVALTANGNRVLDSVTNGINSIGTTATGTLNIRFDGTITAGSTDQITFDRHGDNELSQYGNIAQVSAVAGDFVFMISAVTNETYRITNLTTGSVSNTISINGAGTAGTLGLDSLQGLRLTFDAILVMGETAVFHVSTNNVLQAQRSTQLQSISRFIDEGVFTGRETVELGMTVPGSGRQARIYINATDTIDDLVGKISLAIADPNSTTDLNLEEALVGGHWADLVHFNLTGPARGTMSITSPIPGAELSFFGDESLLNALSLMNAQESRMANYQVSVINIHTGELVAQTTTPTGVLNGILPGLEIRIDTTQGFKVDPNDGSGMTSSPWNLDPYLAPNVSITADYIGVSFIHVVPNAINFQIGPNQGLNLEVAVAQTDASSLGIRGLTLASSPAAEEAITRVDTAIDRVSSLRAQLGSVQNRLESTIRNLDISRQNLASAESGIRDLNIAEQTIAFTREQILLQSGMAVLAQANALSQNVLQLLR
jgi:flagellin